MTSHGGRAALFLVSLVTYGGGCRNGAPDARPDAGASQQDGSSDSSDLDSTAVDAEWRTDASIDAPVDTPANSLDSSGNPDRTPDGSSTDDGAAGDELCTARTGGALVTLRACGRSFAVWITNKAFVDEAIQRKGAGRGRIPVLTLRDGRDCDSQWSWHVDPERASFADFTIELCDGCPSFVESAKAYWINRVKSYCPSTGEVIDVHDWR
jgi:hypothetical protein